MTSGAAKRTQLGTARSGKRGRASLFGDVDVLVKAAVLCYSLEANGLSHLTGCGMTGEVDLAGRVLEVDQLPAKLAMAMQASRSHHRARTV